MQAQLTIDVQLSGPDAGGTLILALCAGADPFDSEEGCATKEVQATGRVMSIPWPEAREGTYAIKIFHDVNGNGKLDTNFLGIPTEPYGFSNNAMGAFGPPSFEEASFRVSGNGASLSIRLK